MRVVSRWAAAVAAASMANCLMARSSKYFCSHLVISASSARICSSFSRSCSESRKALSSGCPALPPLGVPACLYRERSTVGKGGGRAVGATSPCPSTRTLTYTCACSAIHRTHSHPASSTQSRGGSTVKGGGRSVLLLHRCDHINSPPNWERGAVLLIITQ